ncbi:DNA ligase (plasmid) [Oscillospiraceae bacterium MB08-C2-2]|nr:DNA ligase [Oscillospiraceae bacterium MB08-C2-2]
MADIFEDKRVTPMLIAEEKPAFDDPEWLYELKPDGVRCFAYLDTSGTILRDKRNTDKTAIFPELGGMNKQITRKRKCLLDGEIYFALGRKEDFYEAHRRSLMKNNFKIQLAASQAPIKFMAFDILYWDGKDVSTQSLLERKSLLQKAVKESEGFGVSRFVSGQGIALYNALEPQGFEGIVAKRKDSKYYFGKRTKDWIKCKTLLDDDFVVCGYYQKAENLISVILGSYMGDSLVYRGHVVMGVSRQDYKQMTKATKSAKQKYYADFPDFEGAEWLKPKLVCTVRFMEYTPSGGLRQPAFKGLRDDKVPEDCKAPQ